MSAYSLAQDIAELIDTRIPDLEVPDSIVRTYLVQILAQPEGRGWMGRFLGPQSGHTVGTALVEHREHRLGHALVRRTVGGLALPVPLARRRESLLRMLMELGVDLSVPNLRGRSALLHSLVHGIADAADSAAVPSALGTLRQLDKQELERVFLGDPGLQSPGVGTYSLLQVDPDGTTVLAAWFAKNTRPHVQRMITDALGAPARLAADNARWARASAACASSAFKSFATALAAHWQSRALESELPPAPPQALAPPRM